MVVVVVVMVMLEVVEVVEVVVDKRKMRGEPAAAAVAAHGKRKRPRAAGRFGTTRRRACRLGAIQVRGEAHRRHAEVCSYLLRLQRRCL